MYSCKFWLILFAFVPMLYNVMQIYLYVGYTCMKRTNLVKGLQSVITMIKLYSPNEGTLDCTKSFYTIVHTIVKLFNDVNYNDRYPRKMK